MSFQRISASLIRRPGILLPGCCSKTHPVSLQFKRFLKDRKKFYKNVSISQADGLYEVNLDKNKLKTPLGTLFRVPTEPLAIAVATEWDSQKEHIRRHTMYMNILCNSAIDNPTERSKETVIQSILHFLDTDTLCFRLTDPPELGELQDRHWDPIIDWFNKRYSADIQATNTLLSPGVSENTQESIKGHLRSHNDWAIVGFESAVHSLKSLILAFALMDREVDAETALKLSRLELEFQVSHWGRVEWSHDIEFADLKARISAAALFVHLVLESSKRIQKMTS